MPINTMVRVIISGPEIMLDSAIRKFVINRDFHPQNAKNALMHVKELDPYEVINPYTEKLEHCNALLGKLGISMEYRGFSNTDLQSPTCSVYIDKLSNKIDKLLSERIEQSEAVTNCRFVGEQLSHFDRLDVELSSLFSSHFLKCRLGRIQEELLPEFENQIAEIDNVYYFETEKSEHFRYGIYFLMPDDYEQIDLAFATHGFERIMIELPDEINVDASVSEVIKSLHDRMDKAVANVESIEEQISSIASAEFETILSVYSNLKFLSEAYELRSYAGKRHGRFYLVGNIPKSLADTYENECETMFGLECVIEENTAFKPPTKEKKHGLFFNKKNRQFI